MLQACVGFAIADLVPKAFLDYFRFLLFVINIGFNYNRTSSVHV